VIWEEEFPTKIRPTNGTVSG